MKTKELRRRLFLIRHYAAKIGKEADSKQGDFMREEDEWKEAERYCIAVNKIMQITSDLLEETKQP